MGRRGGNHDRLSLTFAALADPTRRAIAEALRSGAVTVSELAVPFAMTLPAITKHLKVLENAGLIERTRDAQKRPCRLRIEPLLEADAWIEKNRYAAEQRLNRVNVSPKLTRDRDILIGEED
jgi:DNA-binding transcriptional ArsR family regulator